MLKHIVMWKFKEDVLGKTKEENIRKAKSMLESLDGVIGCLADIEVGINVEGLTGSFDLVLYSSFKDDDALREYQVHPEHLKVGEFMKQVVEERACVDYII